MKQLQAQAVRAEAVANGQECPECGATGGIDDNGPEARERSFCCSACGEQWDRAFWLERLADFGKL